MEADILEAIPLAISYPPEGRVNFPASRGNTNTNTNNNRPFDPAAGPTTSLPDQAQAAEPHPQGNQAQEIQPEAGSSAGHSRWRPVVWPVCAGPSTKPTVITFRNATDTAVQPYWVDYDGKEVPYECLQPGRVYRQRSFVQHPWVFRDKATHEPFVVGKRVLVFPQDASRSEMVIKRPELLPWSTESHHRFPKESKDCVAALLLCCNRLTRQQRPQNLPVRRRGQDTTPLGGLLAGLPLDVLLVIIARAAPVQPDIEGVCCGG
ncbi:hypothetical protein CLOM_g13946 [Closterium sp. NIES-68]|nr:hypothetical protein CLOM_g13946 [Closterium sp. NIES-68]GJP85320.1 hypothetical protein CLOP_g15427 [Closterium sp. NIES-67]